MQCSRFWIERTRKLRQKYVYGKLKLCTDAFLFFHTLSGFHSWSIIIRDSLMKNLKYSVLINRSQEFKTIDDFEEGKHVNQKVFGLRIPTKTPVVHQLLKHSDSVKHLSLFQCKMDAKSLCGIVNMFKQTVHLVLDNVEFESGTIGGYEESAGLRLNLPKLKHLEIIDSDSKLCDVSVQFSK